MIRTTAVEAGRGMAAIADDLPSQPTVIRGSSGVVPFGPRAVTWPVSTGLEPRSTVSATRTQLARASVADEGALMVEARANFQEQRGDVINDIKRHCPNLDEASVNALADEWVSRSVARYASFLRGYNDALESFTVPGLLLTIAYEGTRPASDPIRATADEVSAAMVESFKRAGLSERGALFQVHTTAARLTRSTAGWNNE